jgi:hypothetical protein
MLAAFIASELFAPSSAVAHPASLGNLVWKDNNNNGLYEPARGEFGINNVTVELYRDDGDGIYGEGDTMIASRQTKSVAGVAGIYRFTNLAPGSYLVRIPPTEFQPGGDLTGYISSLSTDTTPDNKEDNDDNGIDDPDPQLNGVTTNAITIIVAAGSGAVQEGKNQNDNLTLDLGFIPLMSLGNTVWKDANNDGLFNNAEQGVNGVMVELYRDTGDGIFNINNDALVATATTRTINGQAGGYSFTCLLPATYFVYLPAANFAQNAVLAGYLSSTGVDTGGADNNDNGIDCANPPLDGIYSAPVILVGAGKPETAVDGDDRNDNQTVDFGFFTIMNPDNRVSKDN